MSAELVIHSPYARTLGLKPVDHDGQRVLHLPPHEGALGRPDHLHGGAIAGLLEIAAWAAVRDALHDPQAAIRPIGITVDYLRGGRLVDTFAAGTVERLGRRIAHVYARAWQEDPDQPIATCSLKFRLGGGG